MKKRLSILCVGALSLIFVGNTVFAVEGTVTGSNVRIRKEASKTSEEVSLATKDEKVNVIGEEGDWYKVEFEDVTGYISKDYVDTNYSESSSSVENPEISNPSETDSTDDETEKVVENSSNETSIKAGDVLQIENEANIRNLPNFSSRVNSSIAENTEVTVKDVLNNWLKVTDGNVTGWILKSEAKGTVNVSETPVEEPVSEPETSTEEPTTTAPEETVTSSATKKGVINVDSAKIRTSPNGTVIDVVDLNDEVEILSEEDDWYKINIGENKGCYIAKRLVTVK